MQRQIRQRAVNAQIAQHLQDNGLPALLARLYAARGVQRMQDTDQALAQLLPPQGMLHLDRAAVLLADAIAAKQKLLIVTDYDCDGATACAVGIRALRSMGAVVDYLVPNRFETGYGLTPEVITQAIAHPHLGKPDWIITADNGISSLAGVEAANANGIRVLVTDHHLPGPALPAATCIVNPNQPGCSFASKSIAGVGVMFYVMLALRAELRQRQAFAPHTALSEPRLDGLLDLVALGTIADVVKLDANNRILVAQGLMRMRKGLLQPGVRALFKVSGRSSQSASCFDLGFALGPRINAAGRLEDMSIGIECLLTQDEDAALELAGTLDHINRERRAITEQMQAQAQDAIDDLNIQQQATICVFDEGWHQGVVGIVAGKVKERFYRPTIAFAPDKDGILRGSGRSIPKVHLRDALDLLDKQQPRLMLRFGGHAMAAGLSIMQEHYSQFVQAFEVVVRGLIDQDTLQQVIQTDGPLDASEIRPDVVQLIESQVWGQGFEAPLFCDEFTVVQSRLLKDTHLKLVLAKDGVKYEAVWFFQTLLPAQRLRVVYCPINNEYQGNITTQLRIEHAVSA